MAGHLKNHAAEHGQGKDDELAATSLAFPEAAKEQQSLTVVSDGGGGLTLGWAWNTARVIEAATAADALGDMSAGDTAIWKNTTPTPHEYWLVFAPTTNKIVGVELATLYEVPA